VFFLRRHEYLPPVTARVVGPNWCTGSQTGGQSGGDDGRSGVGSKGDES